MNIQTKNAAAWVLVSVAAGLSIRVAWLWNRMSPIVAAKITGIVENLL